jgi:hypothetical protein
VAKKSKKSEAEVQGFYPEEYSDKEQEDSDSGDLVESPLAYVCQCGFQTQGKKEFTTHLLRGGREDGKGVHASRGVVNTESGEVVVKPWSQRSDEEKEWSKKGGKTPGKVASNTVRPASTAIIDEASSIIFKPRFLQANFTIIMRTAYDIFVNEYGWKPGEFTMEDLIDTIFVHFFRDRQKEIRPYGQIADSSVTPVVSDDDYGNGHTEEPVQETQTYELIDLGI